MSLPSFSQSVYAVYTPEDVVERDGCGVAGAVLLIVVLGLVVWLVITLVRGGPACTTCGDGANYRVGVVHARDEAHAREALGKDGVLLFQSPHCTHCQKMMPEVRSAARELAKPVVAVDVSKGNWSALIDDVGGVEGVPSLYKMANGTATPYEGQRTAKAIVDFAQ